MTVSTTAPDHAAPTDHAGPPKRRPARVAVVAHRKKTFGGGLDELRRRLTAAELSHLDWYEVSKSRKAGKQVRRAVREGAELVFVWGGDGMVQRCVDALAGSGVPMAVLPAGTANLLAGNLGIPSDLAEAVEIGLSGADRRLDLGRVNGEHFAVMAGAGFDGELIHAADRRLKARAGKLAYVVTGLRRIGDAPVHVKIKIDGAPWFDEPASCVLLGNVGTITGGIRAFDDAEPDDGWLEVGVATAQGAVQWARTFASMTTGRSDRSPFVRVARAKRVSVRFAEPVRYELDGGSRARVTRLKARVVPAAVTVRVPPATS